ncbi:RimK/LysX family protein [bacterium]|nr:RimK/LysX family protein [bacterium]
MKTFLQYIEEKSVLGLIEFFDIEGIGKVPAKLDSGNGAYNVLHGEDIQEQGNKVFFRTINGRTLLLPKVGEISINIGSGNIEQRPVVEMDFKVGDKEFIKIPFSLGNRSSNLYKILVGKEFIEKDLDALIDVSKEDIANKNITAEIDD